MYKYVKCVGFPWPVKKTYKTITLLLYIHIYIVVVVSTVQRRKKRFSSIKHKLDFMNRHLSFLSEDQCCLCNRHLIV